MKTKADIIDETTVRVLLDRWYDGTATAADEDALTLYFTTSEYIPEDLRADAAVFALPTEKSQSMSEDIPSDLMAQVNGAIIAEKARKRHHPFGAPPHLPLPALALPWSLVCRKKMN